MGNIFTNWVSIYSVLCTVYLPFMWKFPKSKVTIWLKCCNEIVASANKKRISSMIRLYMYHLIWWIIEFYMYHSGIMGSKITFKRNFFSVISEILFWCVYFSSGPVCTLSECLLIRVWIKFDELVPIHFMFTHTICQEIGPI